MATAPLAVRRAVLSQDDRLSPIHDDHLFGRGGADQTTLDAGIQGLQQAIDNERNLFDGQVDEATSCARLRRPRL
jgi:hypothetical protein